MRSLRSSGPLPWMCCDRSVPYLDDEEEAEKDGGICSMDFRQERRLGPALTKKGARFAAEPLERKGKL